MRIRSIKAEYWQHVMHSRISLEAACLGAAMLNFADDDGRAEAAPSKLQALLSYRQIDAEKCLGELAGVGWVILYEVELDDGCPRRLFQVRAFARHQAVSKYKKSHLPPPPGYVLVAGKWEKNDSSRTVPGMLPEESGSREAAMPEASSDGGERVPAGVDEAFREDSGGKEGSERRRSEGRNPRGRAGGGSALPLFRRIEELEKRLAAHPGNPKGPEFRPGASESVLADFREKRAELENLKKTGAG